MRAIYFDAYSGVAGDMILASLLDLGLDRDQWLKSLQKISVKGVEISFEHVMRQGISAQRVEIKVTQKQPERHLSEVQKIIEESRISEDVKRKSIEIFVCLAKAEAKVHGSSPEKVHFHEVGAVDAIMDVVGTCLAIEQLEIGEIYCSPIGLGRGISSSAHGPMPLPPPATLEILKDSPVHFHEIDTELATPTGTAIIKTLACFESPPAKFTINNIGYGAGSKTIPQIPNVLRAILLDSVGSGEEDEAILLETNIDDMNPEIYPHVIEKLLSEGAMDAYLIPVVMKKGRPGIVLSAFCSPEKKDKLINAFYTETTTLGIRISRVERLKLLRHEIYIDTCYGTIRAKEAEWRGKTRITPEFEACRKISTDRNIPLQDVYNAFFRAIEHREREIKGE